MANCLKLYQVHSFSTSPNPRQCTTVLNADVPNCYITLQNWRAAWKNFTYVVFAGIALFRRRVFRSVSVIFIICFEERKLCVNLSKSRFIILLSYYPYAFEQCFRSINWVIEVTCRNRVVWRSFLCGRT